MYRRNSSSIDSDQALAGLPTAGREPALSASSVDKGVLIFLQTEPAREGKFQKGTAFHPPIPFPSSSNTPGSSPVVALFQKKEPGAAGAPGADLQAPLCQVPAAINFPEKTPNLWNAFQFEMLI